MIKKLLLVLLIGVLLGLSACGNADTEESKEAGGIAIEEPKVVTGSMQETEAVEDEVIDTEVDSSEKITINQEPKEPVGDYVQTLFDESDDIKLYEFDLFEDGMEDIIQLSVKDDDKYVILVNNKSCVRDKPLPNFSKAFLVKKYDRYYLYLQFEDNTDTRRSIEVLNILKENIDYVGYFDGQLMKFEDPNCFKIRTYIDPNLLETEYCVGYDGMPALIQKRYKLIQYDERRTYDYISLVDIPAKLVDVQGNLLGTTYNFPAGTEFLLVYTDGTSYYDVIADDGQYCRHYINQVLEGGEYHLTINGLDLKFCMEEFPTESDDYEISIEAMYEE